jgi:DNA-directed RNA polymerase subunit L
MNVEQLKQQIQQLDESQLQAVLNGQALKSIKDESLDIGKKDDAYVFFYIEDEQFDSPEELRQYLLENAETLLEKYYQYNPISPEAFNRQLMAVIADPEVAKKLALLPNKPNELSVFVEGDQVVLEGLDSPRFKYGLHLTLTEELMPQAVVNKVKNWVQSGEAYRDYISANVCRFSCVE